VAAIRGRGVSDIRSLSGDAFTGDVVDVGKHLRPNWRDRRMVLFVEPSLDSKTAPRAAKLT
jgi:hypothetical protein